MRAGAIYIADLGQARVRGAEQGGVRPVLVVHGHDYERIPNLALVCPFTTTHRGVPNHVSVAPNADNGLVARSFVMTEQVRAIDTRFIRQHVGSLAPSVLAEVLTILTGRLLARR
ncbi:type II toxin-antitoxin system PemK/MazF family toxin [Asanoa sp. WMMD1127]|uniref:type II toxin-antitoxin system PemK/MazF family toxin n=1 Tax=Asanoa sp. WMMD1127 TaxID=3016107 RepID=UPI002415BB6A|nr:type II toxin-antitoxin system PemK/MazF family toxin [Asanoa sp. WMMD1127]MDG4823556.1 type II toxin-antitoxin system PemK/MazF family toxin [Asanoa sp. WMMD1127]